MLPDPLHPAVVHFPIVLAVIAPIFAVGALWAIRRGANARRAWGLATAVVAALALSAWVATETGEAQEETVEAVVAERPFETHENAAKTFVLLSAGGLAVVAVGLVGGTIGRAGRIAGTAATLLLLGAGWRVGKSGGELVYRHGAASAYTRDVAANPQRSESERSGRGRDRDQDDDRQ
jgi:uncharacterized membrane protein